MNVLLSLSVLLLGVAYAHGANSGKVLATCQMHTNPTLVPGDPGYQPIKGRITFYEEPGRRIRIQLNLRGFNATDDFPSHGFHVHEFGVNRTDSCESAGGHFDPLKNNTHGGPGVPRRHVGDLGNITEDRFGNINYEIIDDVISFEGINNITGRTLDIHETFDDLGIENPDNGNSGLRIACCLIIRANNIDIGNSAPSLVQASILSSVLLALLAKYIS